MEPTLATSGPLGIDVLLSRVREEKDRRTRYHQLGPSSSDRPVVALNFFLNSIECSLNDAESHSDRFGVMPMFRRVRLNWLRKVLLFGVRVINVFLRHVSVGQRDYNRSMLQMARGFLQVHRDMEKILSCQEVQIRFLKSKIDELVEHNNSQQI